ncbi:MAG: class II aldolase/adducin family protein [Spirochaetales bacterium]|nr:class II aldolase/adducin family protein [Spirochaetales bacterium]
MQEAQEGVIKFQYEHFPGPLKAPRDLLLELMAWRAVLRELTLIGQEAGLYDEAGYGNVSARLPPYQAERGERRFVITGTQTGGLACTAAEHFCVIDSYDTNKNQVRSGGPSLPSSESMTHGTVYDLDSRIRFVFHGHARLIWPLSAELSMATSRASVPYGTPAMAQEVRRLYRETNLPEERIFSMGGHEDGIVSFGETAQEAGSRLLNALVRARMILGGRDQRICDSRPESKSSLV